MRRRRRGTSTPRRNSVRSLPSCPPRDAPSRLTLLRRARHITRESAQACPQSSQIFELCFQRRPTQPAKEGVFV